MFAQETRTTIMNKDEALKLALEALEQWNTPLYKRIAVINKIKEALAQPSDSVEQEQEPVERMRFHSDMSISFAPPKRPWVWLTDAELEHCDTCSHGNTDWMKKKAFARAIEAKLKEKNL